MGRRAYSGNPPRQVERIWIPATSTAGDPAKIAGCCGEGQALDDTIAPFAPAYLDQTERNDEVLGRARRSGRIHVTSYSS
jgi:hypothetical protein